MRARGAAVFHVLYRGRAGWTAGRQRRREHERVLAHDERERTHREPPPKHRDHRSAAIVADLRRAQALTGSVSWRGVRFPEIAGLFRFIWRHAGPRASGFRNFKKRAHLRAPTRPQPTRQFPPPGFQFPPTWKLAIGRKRSIGRNLADAVSPEKNQLFALETDDPSRPCRRAPHPASRRRYSA